MARDGGFISLEKLGDLPGGKPYGLVDETHVDPRLAILGLEKENLAGIVHIKVCSWREYLGD